MKCACPRIVQSLALAVSAACAAATVASAQDHARPNARREIAAANERHINAYNAGDVATFVRVYAPDATLMPSNSAPIHGQDAIGKFWQGGWTAGIRNVKLTTTELDVHGNTAAEVGQYQFDVQAGNAPATHDHGKYIVLWKRSPQGQWQWYRDIFNSDVAPASSASGSSTSAASGQPPRAAPGDSVWVILNPVRADRRSDFEEFVRVFWGAGVRASNAKTRESFTHTRVLYPARANPDGTYTYLFVMDPLLTGANYNIQSLAHEVLPDAEATRVLGLLAGARAAPYTGLRLTEAAIAPLNRGSGSGAP
jgi:uncharacterized protein (TIGR02246 family)